jgi:hypothetical protein
MIALDAVVHQLSAPLRADHPKRRQFALADASRELDEHLPAVIEGAKRPPCRIVPFDPVSEIERVEVDTGLRGHCHAGTCRDRLSNPAGRPAPHLRAYPVETVVAEKLEALVVLGMANSRLKDF